MKYKHTLDEIIDNNLESINNGDGNFPELLSINGESANINGIDFKRATDILVGEDLIEVHGHRCDLLPLGREVLEKGGWLKYVKMQKRKEQFNNIPKLWWVKILGIFVVPIFIAFMTTKISNNSNSKENVYTKNEVDSLLNNIVNENEVE